MMIDDLTAEDKLASAGKARALEDFTQFLLTAVHNDFLDEINACDFLTGDQKLGVIDLLDKVLNLYDWEI